MLDPNKFDSQLSIEEYKRYSRHLVLEEVGAIGQMRLKASKVLIVGLGGLGSIASTYLAAAGVGQLGIVDFDRVSVSNLQRQIIYDTESINKKKYLECKSRLIAVNPNCKIVTFDSKLDIFNAFSITADYDLIFDASDNFSTRYLLNDISCVFNIPLVYGAILRGEGQIAVFNYRGGPTYKDFLEESPSDTTTVSCSEGGVLGGVAALISSLQVNEVMKIILGLQNVMSGKVLSYNFSSSTFKTISVGSKFVKSRGLALKSLNDLRLKELDLKSVRSKLLPVEIEASDLQIHVSRKSCVLVDVRTSQEYHTMHLTCAKNVPLSSIKDKSFVNFFVSSLSKGQYLLIYCSSNSRSIAAVNILSDLQIDAYRLIGGLKALGF
nr:moeB [Porphyrostromium boryanum]